jgi:NAD(P)H-nitrite reductase large subunit
MKIAIAPRFGVGGSLFSAAQWRSIGEVLANDATVEFTTFKQLYAEIEDNEYEDAKQRLEDAGLEVYPTGFFSKNLQACNFCRGAEDAGLATALKLNELVAGLPVASPLKVGYAGCANATSEPLFKDIGVVKMKEGFNVYVGGEGKSLKASVARLLVENVTENRLYAIINLLISQYQTESRKKERYSRFVQRLTIERIREKCESLSLIDFENDYQ